MRPFLALLIIAASALAAAPANDSWVFETMPFGGGNPEVTPTLSYDGGLVLTIDSTAKSKTEWRLFKTIPHPPADSFSIEFEVKVEAPGMDFDAAKTYTSGETKDNDGPNLFVFVYDDPNATTEKPSVRYGTINPFPLPATKLCHIHMECNWMGEPGEHYGFLCTTPAEGRTYAGWVVDGRDFASAPLNDVTAEALQQGEWKKIRMDFASGDCRTENQTITIIGIDSEGDKTFKWTIRNIELVTTDRSPISLDNMYQYDSAKKDWTPIVAPAYCGDAKKNAAGEECDGSDGIGPGLYCSSACKLETVCGDAIVAGQEACDGLKVEKGFQCSSDCKTKTPICGDNLKVAGEACDGTQVTFGYKCQACKKEVEICGDDQTVGKEECDGTNGTLEGFACATDCTLYRSLADEQQQNAQKIINLILQSEEGQPSIAEFTFAAGNLTAEDITDQAKLRNVSLGQNVTIKFCVSGFADCEENYVIAQTLSPTEEGITATRETAGLLKVYKVPANGTTTYFIGFKTEKGLIPVDIDTNLLLIGGIVVFLLVVSGIVLALVLGGYLYYSKKSGVQFGKKPPLS
jgi:hypothetical protein